MVKSKAALVVIAALAATMSTGAWARGHSGGGANHGSHASTGSIGFGHTGSHPYTGVRLPPGHLPPPRHGGGGARVGVVVGVPVFVPAMYPVPAYYYASPPAYTEQEPEYVEPAPSPAYWYFCPQLNEYYPYVQECPGGWQAVLPQPPG